MPLPTVQNSRPEGEKKMFFNPFETYDWNDMLSDKTQKLAFSARIKKLENKIPEVVKNSSERTPVIESLSDGMFALVVKEGGDVHRKFPISSPECTWLSQESFLMNQGKIPLFCRAKTANCIKKACEFFGLEASNFVKSAAQFAIDETNYTDFDSVEVKQAQDEYNYKSRFVSRFALGDAKTFPLNTELEIKTACDFFSANHKSMDDDKIAEEFATNLKTACIRNKIAVPDIVYEYTNDCAPVSKEAMEILLKDRIDIADNFDWDEEKKESVKKSYEMVAEQAPYMRPSQIREMIRETDGRIYGFDSHRRIASPELVVEYATKQALVNNSSSVLFDDPTQPKTDLNMFSDENSLRETDYKDFDDELKKNPLIISGYFPDDVEEKIKDVGSRQAMKNMERTDKKLLAGLIREKAVK
jgi:hypothetical protein